jgi:hypothetical protein
MIKYYAGNKYAYEFHSNKKEYKNYKYWCIEYKDENGILHREDGPSVEYSNGKKQYWYNGERIHVSTDKQFKQLVKLKIFL